MIVSLDRHVMTLFCLSKSSIGHGTGPEIDQSSGKHTGENLNHLELYSLRISNELQCVTYSLESHIADGIIFKPNLGD